MISWWRSGRFFETLDGFTDADAGGGDGVDVPWVRDPADVPAEGGGSHEGGGTKEWVKCPACGYVSHRIEEASKGNAPDPLKILTKLRIPAPSSLLERSNEAGNDSRIRIGPCEVFDRGTIVYADEPVVLREAGSRLRLRR